MLIKPSSLEAAVEHKGEGGGGGWGRLVVFLLRSPALREIVIYNRRDPFIVYRKA